MTDVVFLFNATVAQGFSTLRDRRTSEDGGSPKPLLLNFYDQHCAANRGHNFDVLQAFGLALIGLVTGRDLIAIVVFQAPVPLALAEALPRKHLKVHVSYSSPLNLILQSENEVRRVQHAIQIGVIRKVRRLDLRAVLQQCCPASVRVAVLAVAVILPTREPALEEAAVVVVVVVEGAEEDCRPSEEVWLLYAVA